MEKSLVVSTSPVVNDALGRRIRRRGATAIIATLTAALSVGIVSGPAAGATTAAAALPVVNHERLVLAAQLDPSKPDRGLTSGAEASVKTIKSVLRAKGFLVATDTDGHFGRGTMDAWRKWEDQVHADPLAWSTNGLPSLFELNALAPNRFTVSAPVDQGAWVTENGEEINERTRAMFRKAEALSASDMTITQGRGGAEASAGTHVGGGVIDIRVIDNPAKTNARVAALRQVGFAAWFRDWAGNEHIHAIAVGDPWVAYGAHRSLCQIYQFRFGGEGGSCSDSTAGADRPLVWWEQYKRTP